MVEQAAKKYRRDSIPFMRKVRIQLDMYDDLFQRRLNGEKIMVNKLMEYSFTHGDDKEEKLIAEKINRWHEQQIHLVEKNIFTQKKRLADAERILAAKPTKKAENDRRIASDKIAKYSSDLKRHRTIEITSESEQRIFPGHYMSMLCLDSDRNPRVIPVRYLMRPHDKDESFDLKFNGCYNARLDSLDRVAWWKNALGKRHGLIMVKKFYENVPVENYQKKFSLPDGLSEKRNLVLCFEPKNTEYMFIPTLWDVWEKKGQPSLYSAALITDEPEPEIADAGHDRTPIFLKESAIERWLLATESSVKDLTVLSEREHPSYLHRIMDLVA